MRHVRAAAVLITGLGLIVCTAVHLSTFSRLDPERIRDFVGVAHLGVMAVVAVAAGVCQASGGRTRPVQGVRTWFPVAAGVAFFAGHMILCWAGVWESPGGVPSRDGEGYRLHSHGRTIRALTADEYRRAVRTETRFHAASLVLFSAVGLSFAAHSYPTRSHNPST